VAKLKTKSLEDEEKVVKLKKKLRNRGKSCKVEKKVAKLKRESGEVEQKVVKLKKKSSS
jgi:hypothetical protein